MKQLILIRHGESIWNKENRFTGWTDVGLTQNGVEEAANAGRLLSSNGYTFDVAYTSLLQRAIKTLWIALEEMKLMWVPVERNWRLNERHYGALQGLDKNETVERFGEKQVMLWRRSYDVRPPALSEKDHGNPCNDPRYASLTTEEIPLAESLKDAITRLLPYWHQMIVHALRDGKRALVVAHGNSLRGLVKYLDRISDEEIPELSIPTGVPLVYELKDDLTPLREFYLREPEME